MNDAQSISPVKAHRRAMLLAFGLLGLLPPPFCLIFGPTVWVFGNRDLRAMREGKMDPGGERLTRLGRILGITGLLLNLLYVAKRIFIDGVGNMGPMPPH